MLTFTQCIELTLTYFLQNRRGQDDKLFTRHAIFSNIPATIHIVSPEVGESGSRLLPKHSQEAQESKGDFPDLQWNPVDGAIEYVLVSEDADAPLPNPPCHGIYYKIPGGTTSVSASNFEKSDDGSYSLTGGFKYAQNRHKIIYGGPKPLLNH